MTELAAGIRFLHLACSLLLFGALVFLYRVARPAFARNGALSSLAWRQCRRFNLMLGAGALLGVAAFSLAALVVQTVIISGEDTWTVQTVVDVLLNTQYGQVTLVRFGLMALLAIELLHLRNYPEATLLPGLVLAAVLLAAVSLAGHAAAGEGSRLVLQLAADSAHLLAASAWLGGLLPLLVLLAAARRDTSQKLRDAARSAVRRYSILGLVSVSVLAASGVFNAWNLVDDIAPLFATAYGRWLLLKLGLLLPLLGFAAYNLLRLNPALRQVSARSKPYPGLVRRLQRSVAAELGLGLAIVGIVGVLGVLPPARHVAPTWPFDFRWNWEVAKTQAEARNHIYFGAGLAAAGALAFAFGVAGRRRRRVWALSLGLAALGAGAGVALPALSIDAYPTTYRRPAVPYHALSVANGERLYRQYCTGCHGTGGYGDGPLLQGLNPSALNLKRADLTAKHTGDHTAGDLFWWLSHGIAGTPMPAFENILNEDERWDLINFLRALSAAEQARGLAPFSEKPWLVAPDFLYQTTRGDTQNLKDLRGQQLVLLVLFRPASAARLQQLDKLYPELAAAGVEVLAIAQTPVALPRLRNLPLMIEGNAEAFAAYAVFRRSLGTEGSLPDPPIPAHMEFLIDRQGYIRARWIPGESAAWSKPAVLLGEIARLKQEPATGPAPDDHVH